MKLWKDFQQFIARGNLMDLALGIMIGSAFNSIVQSFVKDILTPIIGIFLGRADVSHWKLQFELSKLGQTARFVEITYGKFLQTSLDFFVLALVTFTMVKFLARLKRKAENEVNTEVATPKDIQLLIEIRDLLREKNS